MFNFLFFEFRVFFSSNFVLKKYFHFSIFTFIILLLINFSKTVHLLHQIINWPKKQFLFCKLS